MRPQSKNVSWQAGQVARAQRREHFGHGGATVWLTGLSGSGKTTVAVALEAVLFDRGVAAYRLDGDNLRHGLCGDLGFSEAHRDENIRRAGETARLLADAGLVVVASFISPYEEARARARTIHAESELPFIEVFVDCPLEVAEERDPKGLYSKARAGVLKGFTGVDAPYEPPQQAEVRLHTDRMSVEDEVALVIAELARHDVLP